MDIQFGLVILTMIYFAGIAFILGLVIYTLLLAVKALKIYIKNNS